MKKYSGIFYIVLILLLNACVPIANSQYIIVEKDSNENHIILTATDADNEKLAYEIVEQPRHGQLVFVDSMDNVLNYTPDAGYTGIDSFNFIAKNTKYTSNIATVTINIKESKTNHPPVAQDQNITVDENSSSNEITLIATDEDGDTLSYSIVEHPKHGDLLLPDNSTADLVIYIPNVGYTGNDSFAFIAKDTKGSSAPAVVSIIVKSNPKLLTIRDTRDRSECKKYVEKSGKDLNGNGVLDENEVTSRTPAYETGTPITIEQLKEMILNEENVTAVNTCEITDMTGLVIDETAEPETISNFNQDISQWNTGAVTDMSNMFQNCIFNRDIGDWDVSHVEDMKFMFIDAKNFNHDIGDWDVSRVENMKFMFSGAKNFNHDIGDWNVSRVKNMTGMFGADPMNPGDFNQDIGKWNVSRVESMRLMFQGTQNFNQDIGDWNVSNVRNMRNMFADAKMFNRDIGDWDVSKVETMYGMFAVTENFNQDIGDWDVSSVTDMSFMFFYAVNFNQDIGDWNVSKAENMGAIFSNAQNFNQDISDWNVSNVTELGYAFYGITLDTEIYDAILTKWSKLTVQKGVAFDGGNSKYSSSAKAAREKLINEFYWTIHDGGSVDPVKPVAENQSINLVLNSTENITLKAHDANKDYLTYSIKTQPIHGSLNGLAPELTYTPEASYTGEDSFTFVANDGKEDSSIATVSIKIVDIVENQDSDEDGIPDQIELIVGTDPGNSDENNNGIPDGLEIEGVHGDTFFDMQWHIRSLGTIVNDSGVPTIPDNDLHLENIYAKYMGFNHGKPIIVQVVDTGVDIAHEDLQANVDLSRQNDYPLRDIELDRGHHATMVAGIIGARAFNGLGVRGVAPFVKLSSSNWIDTNQSIEDLENAWFGAQGANEIAISNNSWGFRLEYGVDSSLDYENIIKKGVSELRDGKGRVYVFAAGNDRDRGGNSNLSYTDNNRYVITVAGLNHSNQHAFYSNPGGNILISGYSGSIPKRGPTIGTTYVSGDSIAGYTTWEDDYKHNYTYAMDGTSAAAPTVSGVLALALEACPTLTWRDVKYLVAKTGTKVDTENSNWVQNSAGLWHSSDYGYGLVNAEGMINQCSDTNYTLLPSERTTEVEGVFDTPIPIADGEFVEIGGLDMNDSVKIEWVELTIDSNHTMAGDLKVELISPAGTISNIIDPTQTYEAATPEWMTGGFRFGAAGFIDEESRGAWKVKISDMEENGHTGTIYSVKLKIYGH